LDTERAVGDKFRRGQGGLCSFPARNNEAVISVSPGGGLAGETVKEAFPVHGNQQGQPLTFPGALLSRAGSLSKGPPEL